MIDAPPYAFGLLYLVSYLLRFPLGQLLLSFLAHETDWRGPADHPPDTAADALRLLSHIMDKPA